MLALGRVAESNSAWWHSGEKDGSVWFCVYYRKVKQALGGSPSPHTTTYFKMYKIIPKVFSLDVLIAFHCIADR